jgi:adenine/guanine phosphoribosyltransferase-like PRPP-binding protein
MYVDTSAHMKKLLDPSKRQNTLQWLVDILKPYVDEFDAIAVSGASGMLLASVADLLHKNIILVRKQRDDSHSIQSVEGPRDGRYIILDDIVDSGATVQRMYDEILAFNKHATCVGIVMYYWNQQRLEPVKRDELPGWSNGNYSDYLMRNEQGIVINDSKKNP